MQQTEFPKVAGEHPLDTASRFVGGRSALAQQLNVTVAAVGNWKSRGVPIEKCTAIEFATFGAVRRQDLCPDDWQNIWPELANTPDQVPKSLIVPIARDASVLDIETSNQERRETDVRRETMRRAGERREVDARRVGV